MKILWRDHRELFVMLAGLVCLIAGISIEFFAFEDGSETLAHEIGYAIWLACYLYWLVVVSRKHRGNWAHRDDRALTDIRRYNVADGLHSLKYFVVDESNHTIVNLWRKLRGKLTVRLYKGEAYEGGVFSESITTYVVTKKQLFEMRLRGYGENAPVEVVRKALTDKWMMKFRAWIK